MAEKKYYHDLDLLLASVLKNAAFESLATDPTGADLVLGRLWHNTAESKYKYYDGSQVRTVATMEDIAAIGELKGFHDASTGNVPSPAPGDDVSKGDFWRVSVGGTISGLSGVETLEAGDLIFANVDGATAAADFFGVEGNRDLAQATLAETIIVASLPANTPTNVVPTVFSGEIVAWKTVVGGEEVSLKVDKQTSPNQLVIESNVALTNVAVSLTGKI